MAYNFGDLGRSCIFSGIWGAEGKYFKGAEKIVFRDLGRSMHYFQGSREHRPPWGPQRCDFTGGGGLDPCMLNTLRRE